jgi:RES domain
LDGFFKALGVRAVSTKLYRNIVSIHSSQDLFSDLSDDPASWQMAQLVEDRVKPLSYESATPIIHRPFEDALWFSLIDWPFKHWQTSRFSDGSFGVWYGSEQAETTIYETAFHWYNGFLKDAGLHQNQLVTERKIYKLACQAILLDATQLSTQHPDLIDPKSYVFCQQIGARLHREGHPGIATLSARKKGATNFAILNAKVLSNPTLSSQVSYRLEAGAIHISKQPGEPWFSIDVDTL